MIPRSLEPDPRWPRGQTLRLDGVRVVRGQAEILRGVDLRLEAKRRYVLIGPSGAGKSTLLRLLNRLEEPSSGRIWLGDVPLSEIPVRSVRTAVGQVFQAPRPLPGSIGENLVYSHQVRGFPIPSAEKLAAMLAKVGLDPEWLSRDAGSLSGGERQRLAIATALAIEPEILLLDEPTSALDPASARRIAELLAGLRTISVCHHRGHAPWLGDWGVVLDRGVVVDQGPIADVLSRSDVAWEDSP